MLRGENKVNSVGVWQKSVWFSPFPYILSLCELYYMLWKVVCLWISKAWLFFYLVSIFLQLSENEKKFDFGGSNFSPWTFFLYSDDTFIRQTLWVKQSLFHKFCIKKSFWVPKIHFLFFDFYHQISCGENDFVIQIIWQYLMQLYAICVRPNTPGSNTVVHFWFKFFSWNLSNFVT